MAIDSLEMPRLGSQDGSHSTEKNGNLPATGAIKVRLTLPASKPSRVGRKFRARLPKVKTGCFTCRVRRVKCGEEKPSCHRCWKFGIECDGYQYSKPTDIQQRRIVPKTITQMPVLAPRDMLSSPRFTSEDEGRYYRYYYEDIATQNTGPFRTSLWNRLIPQVGEVEGFIKHAIIALGALSKSRVSTAAWRTHHQYALQQYGKALKGMQIALESDVRNHRSALVSCILVFCFESMAGYQASASIHACGAVKLLHQWSVDEGNHKGRMHPASCAQQCRVEEDLHLAYSGLDLQALLFLDNRPVHFHRRLVNGMTESLKTMPSQFVHLKDSRMFLQIIMRRNFHFISVARSEIEDLALDVDPESQTVAALRPGNNVWARTTSAPNQLKDIPLALRQQRDQYIADIDEWENASSNLFAKNSQPKNGLQDFIVTNLLKIHAALNAVTLAHTFFPPETEYDAYLSDFRTITELSTLIYPHLVSPTSSMFHFDLGIIPALSQAGGSCRDSKIRHQAIDLLLKNCEYREGIWDSGMVGKVNEAIVNIEEEWMDDNGNIPGNRRARLLKVDCILSERKAFAIYRQRAGTNREEDVVDREIELRW